MPDMTGIEALIVGALVLLTVLVAWWIFRRRPERVRAVTRDVLDEGAAPAERNTLLVEAPPAVAPPAAGIIGGVGELVSAAAAEETAEAIEDARPQLAAARGEPDDLTRIKGLGPKLMGLLNRLGVTRYEQIAGWGEAEIAAIDPQLGAFQGRIARDNWVEQARYLATGDIAGFEARFGKV